MPLTQLQPIRVTPGRAVKDGLRPYAHLLVAGLALGADEIGGQVCCHETDIANWGSLHRTVVIRGDGALFGPTRTSLAHWASRCPDAGLFLGRAGKQARLSFRRMDGAPRKRARTKPAPARYYHRHSKLKEGPGL
jgi:hypothetical protein